MAMVLSTLNSDDSQKTAVPGIMTRKHLYRHYQVAEGISANSLMVRYFGGNPWIVSEPTFAQLEGARRYAFAHEVPVNIQGADAPLSLKVHQFCAATFARAFSRFEENQRLAAALRPNFQPWHPTNGACSNFVPMDRSWDSFDKNHPTPLSLHSISIACDFNYGLGTNEFGEAFQTDLPQLFVNSMLPEPLNAAGLSKREFEWGGNWLSSSEEKGGLAPVDKYDPMHFECAFWQDYADTDDMPGWVACVRKHFDPHYGVPYQPAGTVIDPASCHDSRFTETGNYATGGPNSE